METIHSRTWLKNHPVDPAGTLGQTERMGSLKSSRQ